MAKWKKKLTEAGTRRVESLSTTQMKANAQRTRELAERAQAKLDAERPVTDDAPRFGASRAMGDDRAMNTTNPNQALWEKGDFTRIAQAMRGSGEALVASSASTPGMDVLDLGCGDGTTAVPEAQRGANVLGVDIAENLVAAGNARARGVGLDNLSLPVRATRPTSRIWPTTASTSSSRSSARCSLRGRTTWRRRWCA